VYHIQIQCILTQTAQHFANAEAPFPERIRVWSDADEWVSWKGLGDSVLHIELRKWADVLLISPLSANTLAKMSYGLCDNLLTNIVRAWDYSKPIIVAPAMNTFMWENPMTAQQIDLIQSRGVHVIDPISKVLACGDVGFGAMASPESICRIVCDIIQTQVLHMHEV